MPRYFYSIMRSSFFGLAALGAVSLFFVPASGYAFVKEKNKSGHEKSHHDVGAPHKKDHAKDKHNGKEHSKAKHDGPPSHAASPHAKEDAVAGVDSKGEYSGKDSLQHEESNQKNDNHRRYAASSILAKRNKELRKHLKHLAQIDRLAALSKEHKNSSLQKKVEMLQSKEDKRHQKVLARLSKLADRTDPLPGQGLGHAPGKDKNKHEGNASARMNTSKTHSKNNHPAKHDGKTGPKHH